MDSSAQRHRLSDINPLPALFTMGPPARDHEAGLRCAVTLFVPLMTLLLLGRLDLAVFVSFGAFTGIYGRNISHGERVRMQARAGSLLIVVMLLASVAGHAGIAEPGNTPWLVLATAIVASGSAWLAGLWRMRPTGSLFQIFAFGAISSLPEHPPVLEGMVTAVSTVLFALTVGISSRWLRPHRVERFRWPAPDRVVGLERTMVYWEAFWHFVAVVLAGALSAALGPVLDMEHGYWAMVAAIVPLAGHSTRYRINRGLQRVIGTFVGLALTAGLMFLNPPLPLLVLIVALLQFAAELTVVRQYMLGQVFVTPLALLSTLLSAAALAPGSVDRSGLIWDRAAETVTGSVVGVACVLFPWFWRKWVQQSDAPTMQIPMIRR